MWSSRSSKIMTMARNSVLEESDISGRSAGSSQRKSSSIGSLSDVPEQFRDIVRNIDIDSPQCN